MIKTAWLFLLIFLNGFSLIAQNIERSLKNIINDHDLPGIQLIYNDGVKTSPFNLGVIKEGSRERVTSNTVFRAGSLGKSVFAYAVMRLYDRGVIALDTPLLHYIGSYDRFNSKDPRFEQITTRMVLSHSSGLDEFGDPEKVRLLFGPGTSFSYSGEGIWFLQKTVEKLTGISLEEVMEEEVFKPLKMSGSTYLHNSKNDEDMLGADNTAIAWAYPNAAFSLITNAHDYDIFLQALLTGQGLKPATRELMFTKQSNAQRFGQPNTTPDNYIAWGLGVGLQQNEKGNAIWHWGNFADEFYSFYIAFPATGQSLAFFSRGASGLKITGQIVDLFLGKQTTWAIKWLHMDHDNPESMTLLYNLTRQQGPVRTAGVLQRLKISGHTFSERDLSYYGNILKNQQKYQQAAAVFKLQIKWYPKSTNAYDSYAEINDHLGHKQLALANYKHSLALDTANINARYHISALESKQHFTARQLQMFEGKFYRNGKKEDLYIELKTKGKELVLTQSWDGNSLKFFHVGGLEFYNSAIGFLLKFTKDKNGKIARALVNNTLPWVKLTDQAIAVPGYPTFP